MKIIKWLDNYFEEVVLISLLIVMVTAMSIQVVARHLFASPLSWSEELTRYLFIYSGFLSASYCYKRNIAIKIDQMVNFLPGKIKYIFLSLCILIQIAFFVYLTPLAYGFIMSSVESGQITAALGIPMWTIQSSTLLCCILSILRLSQKLIENIKLIFSDTNNSVSAK